MGRLKFCSIFVVGISLVACRASGTYVPVAIPITAEKPAEQEITSELAALPELVVDEPMLTLSSTPGDVSGSMSGLTAIVITPDVFPNRPPVGSERRQVCSPLGQISPEAFSEIISNPFESPSQGRDDGHPGVDFAFFRWQDYISIDGHPVQSILGGRVVGLGTVRLPFGNYVIIETPYDQVPVRLHKSLGLDANQSLYHLYAHLQNPVALVLDSPVSCGQVLGYVGTTGASIVPHLHLETRLGAMNAELPQMAFYDTRAQPGEMASYENWRILGAFHPIDPITIFIDLP